MDKSCRALCLKTYSKWDPEEARNTISCVICGKPIDSDIAFHHWLVKRNAVAPKHHHLVDVPHNLVPMHNQLCHLPQGHSRDTKEKCLEWATDYQNAIAIASWYISLWKEHGLTIPTGTPPDELTEPACLTYLKEIL